MDNPLVVVILAAGKGKRLGGDHQKVVRVLNGRPLLSYLLSSVRRLDPRRVVLVVGFRKDEVKAELAGEAVEYVEQPVPMGTGDAVGRAEAALRPGDDELMVLCGDVPFISAGTLERLAAVHRAGANACTILTAVFETPTGYGRILRDAAGSVTGIVEELNASPEQRAIREINTGTYVFRRDALFRALPLVPKDPRKGEYYLTDVVRSFVADGLPVATYLTPDPREVLGLNTLDDWRQAEEYLGRRAP